MCSETLSVGHDFVCVCGRGWGGANTQKYSWNKGQSFKNGVPESILWYLNK